VTAYDAKAPALPEIEEALVFRLDVGSDTLFYAPGYLVVAESWCADEFVNNPGDARWAGVSADLFRQAGEAARQWRTLHERAFAPVCLALYLNNGCNLRCGYCFSEPVRIGGRQLSYEAVVAAARLVADNCRRESVPLTVAFHGGGEPALELQHLAHLLDGVESVAAEYGLPALRYIATNGVMPSVTAQWLARRMDMVGLSCDGPPDIQDSQRPAWGGHPTSRTVERTARFLREAGRPFHVRVTVTAESSPRQSEIAAYACRDLGASEIHVEPVYRVGRAAGAPDWEADAFVSDFAAAQHVAAGFGVPYLTSTSRLGEIHGSYCHVLRQVLQLVAGDVATACFAVSGGEQEPSLTIGRYSGDGFLLDEAAIRRLQGQLARRPDGCEVCVARFHCGGSCPEGCPATGRETGLGFRCELSRGLTLLGLRRTADQLRSTFVGSVVGGTIKQIDPCQTSA
jgi:uncharacterized protein